MTRKIDFESQNLARFDTSHLTHLFSKFNNFSLGMLIFRQKYFLFCIPRLKTLQPVLPYCNVNAAIIMMTTVVNCESQTLPFSHMMWVKISPTRSVCEVQLPPTAV